MSRGRSTRLVGDPSSAADWTLRHLPGRRTPVTSALARVLDLPVPAIQREQ
ncbi:hypothetical protein [Streptomyces sp. NPDC058751]|uniref:hypothetical protein n=1 Tax=Streptomyces sp. NPDC058751 TaxID=3346623 RepID=UPI0036CAE76A